MCVVACDDVVSLRLGTRERSRVRLFSSFLSSFLSQDVRLLYRFLLLLLLRFRLGPRPHLICQSEIHRCRARFIGPM